MSTDFAASDLLAAALEHHQAGRLEAAEAGYLQVLRTDPRNPDGLRLAGVIARQRGQHQRAIDFLNRSLAIAATPLHYMDLGMAYEGLKLPRRAIECYACALAIDPSSIDALIALGNVHRSLGERPVALSYYRAAVAARADDFTAHYNSGLLLHEMGDLDAALVHCRRAAELDPRDIDALLNLGNLLVAKGDFADAADRCRQALALSPNSALVLNNLANALALQGKSQDALEHYRLAAVSQPQFAMAHYNLGGMLQDRGDFAAALIHCRRAVELDPNDADHHFRLGAVLDQLSDTSSAAHSYASSLAINPGHAQALVNLGLIHFNRREPLAAREHWARAVAISPENARAHFGVAVADLQLGNWQSAWCEYEWRLRIPGMEPRLPDVIRPRWNGQSLNGMAILLIDEQGMGDAIQFIRYARAAAARGGRVKLRCRRSLVRLLSTAPGLDGVSSFDEPAPDFDVYCPLLSLPGVFGTVLASVPAEIPYLSAEESRVSAWRARLGEHGYKIGICWRGSDKKSGLGRSFPLIELQRIGAIPGIRLISLQKFEGVEQLQSLPPEMSVETLGEDFDAGDNALLDAAAVIEHLDLVISCDTSIAHLAGALGRPAWLALQYAPDWRWMLREAESPWYPTHRLFRQVSEGCWSDVFEAMYRCLADRI